MKYEQNRNKDRMEETIDIVLESETSDNMKTLQFFKISLTCKTKSKKR